MLNFCKSLLFGTQGIKQLLNRYYQEIAAHFRVLGVGLLRPFQKRFWDKRRISQATTEV